MTVTEAVIKSINNGYTTKLKYIGSNLTPKINELSIVEVNYIEDSQLIEIIVCE